MFKRVQLSRVTPAWRIPQPNEQPPWAAVQFWEEDVVLSFFSTKLSTERFPGNKTIEEKEDLFKGFGKNRERMLAAQKVAQIMIIITTVIPIRSKIFVSQSLAMCKPYKFPGGKKKEKKN